MRSINPATAAPAGWVVLDGLLQPDMSVAGHLARGDEVKGYCDQKDCRRRCSVDLARLTARGFGQLPVARVQQLMRCNTLAGCGLDFRLDQNAGLPLTSLLGRAHVRIRIKCEGCGFFRATSVEALIARLSAGRPTAETLMLSQVRGRITGPCKTCRKSAWRVDVLWPDPSSEGYRRSLETKSTHRS